MQYLYPKAKILIFTKPPLAGKCKSRLVPHLGEDGAALLQQKLLHKIITDLTNFKICPFEIWQSEESNYFDKLKSKFNVTIKTQQGSHLGERMSAAISASLATSDGILLIGSDCAEYTKPYLINALSAVQSNDVVIGPAHDGGYVLIGMSKLHPQIFLDIPWGTAAVLKLTLSKLDKSKIRTASLTTLRDIDRPEDLVFLEKIELNGL